MEAYFLKPTVPYSPFILLANVVRSVIYLTEGKLIYSKKTAMAAHRDLSQDNIFESLLTRLHCDLMNCNTAQHFITGNGRPRLTDAFDGDCALQLLPKASI